MAQAQPRVDGDHTNAGAQSRVFDAAEHVAPTGDDVLTLAQGGGDSKAKIRDALETAANGAVGDNPVERADSVAVVTGQAIPGGGVAEQAEAANNATAPRVEQDDDIMKLIFDPAFVMEYFSREDVLRERAAFRAAFFESIREK